MTCGDNKHSDQLKILSTKEDSYLKLDQSPEVITWCSGCGDFGIQNALKRALAIEGLGVGDFSLFFDIGCNGNGSDKMHAYTFHGLHGRVIPAAAGAAMANPKMKVIASAGDGATFSEGVNHLVHGVRNNYPMVFIHHNNNNYGLTKGQASATTPEGVPMSGSPDGVLAPPLNPCDMVLSFCPSFVARTFSGDVTHMTEMIRLGLQHDGFAFIEVLQTCPTYNKATPQEWYLERVKDIESKADYDRSDLVQARAIVQDQSEELWTGLLYLDESRVNAVENLPNRRDVKTTPVEEVRHYDVTGLMGEFE
jgi:2-oxoglutarate/2-oxoacid ferredoxin oxidoreductase subunit beta